MTIITSLPLPYYFLEVILEPTLKDMCRSHYAAPAAEYNVWCKSAQGFRGTWASVGSARSEMCDTLLTE